MNAGSQSNLPQHVWEAAAEYAWLVSLNTQACGRAPWRAEVLRGAGQITGQVQGTSKLTGSSEEAKKRALPTEKGSGDTIQARIAFEAPCFVRWSRHDKEDKCSFIAAFYAIPAGAGWMQAAGGVCMCYGDPLA